MSANNCLQLITRYSSLITFPQVPAAGVEPAPPRFQHGASTVLASPGCPPVPRQGIEPCVCRLKAGGFAIEACEASSQFRGWNRTSASRLQRAVSVPARNPPERTNRVAGAGIEPASSTFRGWHPYQHGIPGKTSTSSGGRNRTYIMRFNRAPPYHSAPHRCVRSTPTKTPPAEHPRGDARPAGAEPCSAWRHPVRMRI